MSPNIASLYGALDNAKGALAINTAANETAAKQAQQAADYHKQTYDAVLKATQAMRDALKAIRDAEDVEYAVPDNSPADGATAAPATVLPEPPTVVSEPVAVATAPAEQVPTITPTAVDAVLAVAPETGVDPNAATVV